ncbi:RCC1 domain-containing protein [Polyangium sorediatum]|uniref:RCC1-like domain-containing protein n=1 Tax=Polyangium sorediatum TaxID=889274 RepID=A0ABT6P2E5_9BACT|nr:hypothetical protein [Polyangium sorediatum]MDI1434701.1 hypothetical protein [Polyangium sorediatum]
MRLRALALCTLAGVVAVACSGDPPAGTTTAAGSTGAAGAGGTAASSGSGGSGGNGGNGGSSAGEGGGSNPDETVVLTLVSPLPGLAFERRHVDVDVAFSVPEGGATLRLALSEVITNEQSIDTTVTTGTARLRLPRARGANVFVVTIVSASGKTATVEGNLHGGRLVTTSIDTMFALRDGTLVQWGGGDPTPAKKDAPTALVSVAENGDTLFALDAEGHVFKAPGGPSAFEPVPGLEDIATIAPGGGHALFLRADGRLFAAGLNNRGQLGAGDTESHAGVVEVPLDGIVAIAASDDASFAVDTKGLVHAWGSNDEGQLGLGDEDASPHPDPLIVPNLVDIVDVAAGRDHVLALAAAGGLYAWGLGSSGQLGDGSAGILASKPQPVPLVLPGPAIALGARGNTSHVVLASGEHLVWGQNSLAQLGVGDTNMRTKPTPSLVGHVRAISAGLTGGVAVDESGGLQAWGSNTSGQLGLPLPPEGPERSSVPVVVPWP